MLSGLMLTASFPGISMTWLAWFALIPLLYGSSQLRPGAGFRMGFIAGLTHYLTLMYWLAYTMHTYGQLPWLLSIPVLFLLAAWLATYIAFFSMLLTSLCASPMRLLLLSPALWTALEYIRTFLLTGLPWELLGYSQYQQLSIIQMADIFGVYGVSFLIALANAAFLILLLYVNKSAWGGHRISPTLASTAAAVLILAAGASWSYGTWRIQSVDDQLRTAPTCLAMIVQGNVDQSIKWDPAFQQRTTEKYIRLSLPAGPDKPELIVWPETATPFYYQQNSALGRLVQSAIQSAGTCFLIGSPSFVQKKIVEYYNSAYLINSNGAITGKYDKAHLVPFGEYVPLNKWLPFIGKMVQAAGDFRQGTAGGTLSMKDTQLGVQICYEIIFPDLARAAVLNNAGFLVNITNDAWFGRTAAPRQHFSMAIFRAIENKRFLVRSANTGISGFIDPLGRITGSTALFEEKALTRPVAVMELKTFYTRYGDIFAKTCVAVAVIFGIWYLFFPENYSKRIKLNHS